MVKMKPQYTVCRNWLIEKISRKWKRQMRKIFEQHDRKMEKIFQDSNSELDKGFEKLG